MVGFETACIWLSKIIEDRFMKPYSGLKYLGSKSWILMFVSKDVPCMKELFLVYGSEIVGSFWETAFIS